MKIFATLRTLMLLALMLGLVCTLFPGVNPGTTVKAFKPTNGQRINGGDYTHESITYTALRQLLSDQNFIAPGINISPSVSSAAREIAQANANVDLFEALTDEAHFDNESFVASQNRLIQMLANVREALANSDVHLARKSLGKALHALQDFYSHSNWVELGNNVPNPVLGRSGLISNTATRTEATCIECTKCIDCDINLTTTHLTSGYFGSFFPPLNKCGHGGTLDTSGTPKGGINKDTSDCDKSPHARDHFRAGNLAIQATIQLLLDLKSQISPKQLKSLFGVGSRVAICIDTTSSMQPIIEGVKQQLINLINARFGKPDDPQLYILVKFNDPFVSEPIVTTDANVFKSAISSITVSGGGDCPELAVTGIFKALPFLDQDGELFVVTDADAKDGGLAPSAIAIAQLKNIKVNGFIFGNCSSSSFSLSKSTSTNTAEQFNDSVHSVNATINQVDSTYKTISDNTGGQVFALGISESSSITNLIDFSTLLNKVNLLSIRDTLTGIAKNYTVPVDSTLTSVSFSVSGTPSVVIKRPDGSIIKSTDTGVKLITLSSGVLCSVSTPAKGNWTVSITGNTPFSLVSMGESSLFLTKFNFVELGGRLDHEGLFPIVGLPIVGSLSTIDTELSDGFSSASFEFRSQTGESLKKFSLTRDSGIAPNRFSGTVILPNIPFVVYVTGLDISGNMYQRVIPTLIKTQTVQIITPLIQKVSPGQTYNYVVKVKNFGPQDTFKFIASDTSSFITAVSPQSFTLSTGQTIDVTIQIKVPSDSKIRLDTLTAVVQNTDASARNFAVVDVDISKLLKMGEHSTIYVTDTNNSRVQKSTNDGLSWQLVGLGIGTGPGQFNSPKGITSDSNDQNIYVADTNNNRIQHSTDGGISWRVIAGAGVATNQVNQPGSVAYDEVTDKLYIADTRNNRILSVTNAKRTPIFSVLAGPGTSIGQVNQPQGVAVDADSKLYIADTLNNRIQVFNGTSWSIFAGATGGITTGKVNAPRGIYVDSSNRVYIADTGNNRIQINLDQTVTGWTVFMGPGTTLGMVSAPQGVVLAASDNVFIADTGNNRVQKKPVTGGSAIIVGTPGLNVGQFNQPSSIR